MVTKVKTNYPRALAVNAPHCTLYGRLSTQIYYIVGRLLYYFNRFTTSRGLRGFLGRPHMSYGEAQVFPAVFIKAPLQILPKRLEPGRGTIPSHGRIIVSRFYTLIAALLRSSRRRDKCIER